MVYFCVTKRCYKAYTTHKLGPMIKSAIEKVISEDLADIWSILDGDEKRKVIDNFAIHDFKKNQLIYAENEEPEYLWCLMKGKVKLFKEGLADAPRL